MMIRWYTFKNSMILLCYNRQLTFICKQLTLYSITIRQLLPHYHQLNHRQPGKHYSPPMALRSGMIVRRPLHFFLFTLDTFYVLILHNVILLINNSISPSIMPSWYTPNVNSPFVVVGSLFFIHSSTVNYCHVLRIATFTKVQLLSLQGLGISFINERILPRFSFDTLSLPRSSSNVGMLNPLAQQQAPQWNWVCPIFLYFIMNSWLLSLCTAFSLPILLYTLFWF